jgi:oligopeptide/dipeptide ABC transporter ATP-binding protein
MLLSVERLSVSIGPARPLDDVGFALAPGEILGIVGESGAGKSLTAMAVMGLLPLIGGRIDGGAVWFDGVDLARLPEEDYRRLRGRRIALIMQNPMTSLDPITRVGEQIDQVSRLHMGLDRIAARARSIELMGQLKIPEPAAVHDLYPHQLSGGMKQRAVIAMALAADPELIVADEPTTALDVTVQAQIIQLLVELVRDRGLSLMLITHDMGVVAQACDRVAVMYGGRVVERGPVQAIFAQPRHPYTKALIGCIPRAGMAPGALKGIPGTVPSVSRYPSGCRFHPRCPQAQPLCQETVPVLDGGPTGDGVACHFPNGPRP